MKKTLPSDHDHSQVYIVEASAGSGKTYTLAKRYVSLVLNPNLKLEEIPLRSILAITFTNKAAFEMKGRILELLKMVALDCFPTPGEKSDILEPLGASEEFLRQKAHLVLDYLIKNYNFFQVQTIDSFINALLSGCAFKLDLSANFRIKNDYSEYLSYSLDRLIDKASLDKRVYGLFDCFLRQYLYLENRTGWLPKAEILKTLETLLTFTNTYGGNFSKFKANTDDLIEIKKKLFRAVEKLGASLPEGTDKRFQAKVENLCRQKNESIDLELVSSFFDRDKFPVNKGFHVSDETLLAWDKVRSLIRELCETESFAIFNCYIDIFDQFFKEFKNAAAKDDVVFLFELNRQARQLFDSQFVTVPELYFRLSSRFSNYLIDEFQDTSFLQWKNIFPLIEDGLSSAGTLFYVGDKKQAIYRFRGGEVQLFDQVKNQLSAFRREESVLSKNYRSREELVKFNNNVFSTGNISRAINTINDKKKSSAISLTPEDISDIASFFKDSRQTNREDKPSGFVKVESVSGADEERNDLYIRKRLIEVVSELSQRFDYRDIAVLARSNDEVEQFASWLIEEGIAVESDKTLNIREQSLVKELISFLKFLKSPVDNLSFASFILGDIFLEASGLKKTRILDYLFELGRNRRHDENFYYYRKFREDFPVIWDRFISEFFKNVGFVPLYELTVSIISKFRVLQNFPQYHGFFMRLLELITEQEEEAPTINEFLNFFDSAKDEELYVNISQANSVRILTIHKSKGLEFRAVIIPNLSLDIEVSANIVYPEGNTLNLLRLKKEYVKFSPPLENIYRQEYIKAFIDELNNVYVAFTRARDELYVFVPIKKGNRFNYAQQLFISTDYEAGSRVEPVKLQRGRAVDQDILTVSPGEYRDWIPLLKDEYIPADSLQNRKKIFEGETLHLVLSYILDLNVRDLEKTIDRALAKSYLNLPLPVDSLELKEKIMELLERETWKRFFFSQGASIFNEQELITAKGQTKRIDRLMLFSDKIWIVDYKSSRDFKDENYRQMLEYIALVKEIYPGKAIKGFFLYFDHKDVEEIDG